MTQSKRRAYVFGAIGIVAIAISGYITSPFRQSSADDQLLQCGNLAVNWISPVLAIVVVGLWRARHRLFTGSLAALAVASIAYSVLTIVGFTAQGRNLSVIILLVVLLKLIEVTCCAAACIIWPAPVDRPDDSQPPSKGARRNVSALEDGSTPLNAPLAKAAGSRMNRPRKAHFTPQDREAMARAVVDRGLSKAAVARQFNSTRCRADDVGRRPRIGRVGRQWAFACDAAFVAGA